MPWHVEKRGSRYCVIKGNSGQDGPVVKCHQTRKQAEAHQRALYRNTKEEHSVEIKVIDPTNAQEVALQVEKELSELRDSVRGSRVNLYFQEGEKTPDGRVLDPNCVNFNRPPPFSIRLQTVAAPGHDGAVVCGVIDRIYRDGLTIVASGRLDMNSEAGREAERLIREQVMATWSPDLGDATIDIEENVHDEDTEHPQDYVAHFVSATFLGATLVAMPALASAVVELLDENGNVLVAAPRREVVATEPLGTSHDPSEEKHIVDRISACAGPTAPPSSFFSDPQLTEPQRYISITPEGRVFGHLACWGECHIGYGDVCVEPPRGSSYSYFHVGQVRTAEDTLIATGPLTLKGGHAGRGMSAQEAQAHYDDTNSAVADVVLGEDDHGIWFSGALRPTVTDEQLHVFRASGVSGDWRRIGDNLELIGACSVNVPGFPKVRLLAASADEDPEIVALVAAGGAPVGIDSDIDCGCNDCDEEDPALVALIEDLSAQLASVRAAIRASGIEESAWEKLEEDLD